MTRGSIGAVLLALAAGAPGPVPDAPATPEASSAARSATTDERPVRLLPLSGPITRPEAEISALAWYGDTLVLVPQYPHRFGDVLFTLEKSAILAWLEDSNFDPAGTARRPLRP